MVTKWFPLQGNKSRWEDACMWGSYFLSPKKQPLTVLVKQKRLSKGKNLALAQRFLAILGKMVWSLSYQQFALKAVKFGLQNYLVKLSRKSKGGFISKKEINHQTVSVL